jgi:hypothetical protein
MVMTSPWTYARQNLRTSTIHELTPEMLENSEDCWEQILDFFGCQRPKNLSWIPAFNCTHFYWALTQKRQGIVYHTLPLTLENTKDMLDVSIGAIVPCSEEWLENVFIECQGYILISMYYLEKNMHGLCIFSRFRQNKDKDILEHIDKFFY